MVALLTEEIHTLEKDIAAGKSESLDVIAIGEKQWAEKEATNQFPRTLRIRCYYNTKRRSYRSKEHQRSP